MHAGKNRNVKVANKSLENEAELIYLGMTATNQTLINEEIKRRLKSGNACHHSAQNLLTSRLSINVKSRMYESIILPVVL
jgi:hypothetical protein